MVSLREDELVNDEIRTLDIRAKVSISVVVTFC
jgi:hypothetical protein